MIVGLALLLEVVVGQGHVALVENEIAVTRGRFGLSVTSLRDRVVGLHLRELGEWEQPILDVASEVLAPGHTVFEVGAHVGAHTIGLRAAVGPSGTLHVWEPQPDARILLSATVALNAWSGVYIHSEALGNTSDTGRLALQPCDDGAKTQCAAATNGNSGAFSLANQVPGRRRRDHHLGRHNNDDNAVVVADTVKVTSLDAAFFDDDAPLVGGCPHLIKSDAEGMDFRFLTGAEHVINACHPALLFETMAPRRTNDISAFLDRHPSYQCAWLTFRILPSMASAFRDPSRAGAPTSAQAPAASSPLHPSQRTGPMSFNAFCVYGASPMDVAPRAASAGLLLPLRDGTTDVIYAGPDCDEYEARLATEGSEIFSWVTGIAPDTLAMGASPSICR